MKPSDTLLYSIMPAELLFPAGLDLWQ